MKTMLRITRRRRKAQSLIEFALGGMLLMMFLAAAVDFGRVYYTYIVVENMAGEAATYVSTAPDADKYLTSGLALNNTFQGRAINVAARVQGGVISPANVQPPGSGARNGGRGDVLLLDKDNDNQIPASSRCTGNHFRVTVAYHMDDLFFPGILGMEQFTVTAETTGDFFSKSGSCPSS